jgi:hypothetical protein
VAEATRPRGPGNTRADRHGARGVARRFDPSRAFRVALAIAFFLHAPLVPLRIFEWARLALFGSPADYDDKDAQAVVPIDLDLVKDPEPEPPAVPPPAPKPAPAAEGPGDAGAPLDAGKPPPRPHDAPDAGPRPLADPVAAAGGAGKIAAKDANVQVLLAGNVLRRFPAGARVARLLVQIPEWRGFFEGSPVDPIRDFNHILITAPRLRGDTGKLVAVMDYNLSPDLARDAVDQVLRKTNGVWLPDAPVPAARARVGGVMRLFAHLPEKHLIAVLPADAMDQLEGLKRARGFRNSSEAVIVSMVTPARPFRDFLKLPESLRFLRLSVTPTADGGADLALDVGDASHDEAVAHADLLTREIEARRKMDILGFTFEIIDAVTFVADGDVMRARTHVTRQKLETILSWFERAAQNAAPPRR